MISRVNVSNGRQLAALLKEPETVCYIPSSRNVLLVVLYSSEVNVQSKCILKRNLGLFYFSFAKHSCQFLTVNFSSHILTN